MPVKDKRYNTVRFLIQGGHITEFRQIFEHIPKSVVANDLGTHYYRLNRLIEHVDQFTLRELFALGALIELDEKGVLELAYTQYMHAKKPKRKGS